MKVTIEGVIFEGKAEEVYEVLSKLGYKIEKQVTWNPPNTIINPVTIEPYKSPSIPYWMKPSYIGDPPPGTYPQVWCGSGDSTVSLNGTNTCETSQTNDTDNLNS